MSDESKCSRCEKPFPTKQGKTLHEKSCKVVRPEVTKEAEPANKQSDAPVKKVYSAGWWPGGYER